MREFLKQVQDDGVVKRVQDDGRMKQVLIKGRHAEFISASVTCTLWDPETSSG